MSLTGFNKAHSCMQFGDMEYEADYPFGVPSLELSYQKTLSKREDFDVSADISLIASPSLSVGYHRTLKKGHKLSISTGLGMNGACQMSVG